MFQTIKIPYCEMNDYHLLEEKSVATYPIVITDWVLFRKRMNLMGWATNEVRLFLLDNEVTLIVLCYKDGSIARITDELILTDVNYLIRELEKEKGFSFINNEDDIKDFDSELFYKEWNVALNSFI